MKSSYTSSLPTLGLLAALALSLTGLANAMEPGTTFKDCDTCSEMVVVPAGSFKMGDLSGKGRKSWKPVHEVTIGHSFAVGKYEVTQAEWKAVMGTNPSTHKFSISPVEGVTWDDAKSFVKKLSTQTGKEYRLLSEAEWEYMARAGSVTRYPWGDEIDDDKARYGTMQIGPAEVGQYEPNSFGIFDTAGNVYEWTEDCWHNNYNGAPSNGSAWTTGGDCAERVLRGGSYVDGREDYLLSAGRYGVDTSYASEGIGLRVARTLSR